MRMLAPKPLEQRKCLLEGLERLREVPLFGVHSSYAQDGSSGVRMRGCQDLLVDAKASLKALSAFESLPSSK
eukprot:CAMPEP_0206219020 /NCGR_PEP_ID=MMETSP0047_2-20121206/4103_1 /ASSEMBLY_ACC=CAM_ASM_000192 /TAXON_ID=195065 /ORGANISM="Chroomonas mesostigmatica_cf, Strain CCMP1168" /LENGTH=71 /DNA_ID=CAMNT_0053641549 /DNA_START=611 /DNA_END=827 /DNA_ORIENTATION=+